MIIDIDHFKLVNDNHGHSVGDMTLKRFSQIISDFFTGSESVVGRWGGEEFVVVCYDTDLYEIKELAEHLRIKVASESFKAIDHITCSIGVTEVTDNDEATALFERMDKALYDAKSSGRNCVKSLT
jgi:diguanylate cyclase (GGDEF)-like protein